MDIKLIQVVLGCFIATVVSKLSLIILTLDTATDLISNTATNASWLVLRVSFINASLNP